MENSVRLVKWSLFNPWFPENKMRPKHMDAKYVSDAIGTEEILKWHQGQFAPPFHYKHAVYISAQTGKGKNYFITHTLREVAIKNGESILYISNRVALDYQQKRDLANLTHSSMWPDWEKQEEFSNVTVLTYHKLLQKLYEKQNSWFRKFTYVVLDECHFFYSDSFFNPDTWEILALIPSAFKQSIRIYMSATFDDVIDPIRYHEGLGNGLGKDSDSASFFYYFPRYYDQYNICAFSKPDQIINLIEEDKTDNRWVVFVTNRAKGQDWKKRLNKEDPLPTAIYVDSGSRNSDDYYEKVAWEQLKQTGQFASKVLISTSVLDNGFSLKDKKITNIVLFTHDRTEFLQELGRCRLTDNQHVNVFYAKLLPRDQEFRRNQYKRYSDIIFQFCGDEDTKNGHEYAHKGNPNAVIKHLWNVREDPCRGFISLRNMGGGLSPHINQMARWRTLRLGHQIEEYDRLAEFYPHEAGLLYKADWLKGDEESVDSRNIRDIDADEKEIALQKLVSFLREAIQAGTVFEKGSDAFTEFSTRFQQLYCSAYPDDPAINRGKGRAPWQQKALSNRLNRMVEDDCCPFAFCLQEDGSTLRIVESPKN